MRRREFLELSAAGVLCGGLGTARAAGAADEIRGRAVADGKGLANVVVSDGLQCVRTGADGAFRLPRREGARFVAVSPPCGYQMKDWYRRIAPAASYDFALEKAATGKPCRIGPPLILAILCACISAIPPNRGSAPKRRSRVFCWKNT